MPVEVERDDQGEVSVKVVDNENAKQEIVVSPSSKDDVVNGNDTSDSDGSYVFLMENGSVCDDSVGSDSSKPVDSSPEKDLKDGEDLKTDAMISVDDDDLVKDDGTEVSTGILNSEIEDSHVEQKQPSNGHVEIGDGGKLESIEEVEQVEDSEVGPRDVSKDDVEDPKKHESITESNDVDVSEEVKDNEDVAKQQTVDSEEVKETELVSDKVSPADLSDGEIGLGEAKLTDRAYTTNGAESVNGHVGSESVPVLESVENGHPLEKVDDVHVDASDGDVLPESGTVEVVESEVSRDVSDETQTLTPVVSLDDHASGKDGVVVENGNSESESGKDGVVENGNNRSESETIQDLDIKSDENSKVEPEVGAVDVSSSDESKNSHQQSQDLSEPASEQDGKHPVASEVTEVLDVPASEETSDTVIAAINGVSEAPVSDDKQESECDEVSGVVEKIPSVALHDDAPSGNDKSEIINNDTKNQGFSEDNGFDTNQKIQDDSSAQLEEVLDAIEKDAPAEKVQENNTEGDLNTGDDVSGDVSHESTDTLSTDINGPSTLLDSETVVSELEESLAEGGAHETAEVATESEAVQSVNESTEPDVVAPIEDVEANGEVNCGSEVDVTKITPVYVCEDKPLEEVSENEKSDIKEKSAINTEDEAESVTKSSDNIESSLVKNDTIKVEEEKDSKEEKDKTSSANASTATETKTHAPDLESEAVTSTDIIHTGANGCVDAQPADSQPAESKDDKVVSSIDGSGGQTVAAEIDRKPLYYLPKVPRPDGEKLAEQIRHTEEDIVQKTKNRDALKIDFPKSKAICRGYDDSLKAAVAEEKSAKQAMQLKWQEINALQFVISRIKNAQSVDDISAKMHSIEHTIQHETISLHEEKKLIQELNQLRKNREKISSIMGTKDEIKKALAEKEQTEERLKVLREELEVLKSNFSKAEAVAKAAKRKSNEEWGAYNKQQEQYITANNIRQEAYDHLQDLRKQQREQNKYFFKYRDVWRAANEMAFEKDRASLQSLCSEEGVKFMNVWNNDEVFRKNYVISNRNKTIKKFGTLDGRSLGPDEEPPQIIYPPRTDKFTTSSDRAVKQEIAPPVSAPVEKVVNYKGSISNEKAVANPAEQKSQSQSQSQTTKSKKTVKPDQPPVVPKVSEKEETERLAAKKEEEEAAKLRKEKEELIRKEEELVRKEEEKRKQKEAAKMKEQIRLEEMAKAKEAMERKKKQEEKAKARAEIKAQKEAEEKEKKREKKQRKKDKRNGVVTSEETADNSSEISETIIETPKEVEIPKKQMAEESKQISKKSRKASSQFVKQNKSTAMPLPLRNRASKRKLKQWLWVGLAVLVVLALFLLGNANLSFSTANHWFT